MSKSKFKTQNKEAKTNWGYLFVICIVVLCIYAQSIKFDFITFDESTILLDHKEFFTTDFSFKKIFTTSAFIKESFLYRPLQNLSFALDAKIAGGIVPWAFRLSNLVLFILTGFSLYFLLLKFNITNLFALLGTLLFLANPLNVWSVVWAPARGDLLLTLFTVLSFVCFFNFLRKNRFIDLFLTAICFTVALFAKETAVIIPFLFLLYFLFYEPEYLPDNSSKGIRHQILKIKHKHFLLAGLIILAGAFWYYLRYLAIGHNDNIFILNDFIYNLQNIPTALSQILIPYEISPFPKFSWSKTILGILIFLWLLYITLRKTRISRWEKIFFLLWFFSFLMPTLFIRLKNIDYLEHRYLLPQIGIIILIIKQIMPLVKIDKAQIKKKRTRSLFHLLLPHKIIIFLILPVFCITSFVKARTLINPVTVADAAEKYRGLCFYPFLNRSAYYISTEDYDKAVKDIHKVLEIDSTHSGGLLNLAHINMKLNNYKDAISLYSMALLIDKKDYKIYENRAQAKRGTGDLKGALLDIDSAIMVDKTVSFLFNDRGVFKMNLGLYDDVLSDFEEAKRLSNSSNIDILGNCAAVKYHFGDYQGALQDCETALKLDPNNHNLKTLKEDILAEINN